MVIPVDRRTTATFLAFWLFIIFVSVVDGYLAYRHLAVILKFELNPVGRALIQWNQGRVWYLLSAKFAGTVFASAALLLIYRANRRVGLVVGLVLAGFQLGLMMFLLFS